LTAEVIADSRFLNVIEAHSGARPVVVLIDGPSGSGKSTLADAVVAAWPGGVAPQLIRLDSIYPGWQGLASAGEHVARNILEPLAAGLPARWQRYDWAAGALAEWQEVDPTHPLVIEGCGVLTRRNAALADLGIWLEADLATRKARALARDGDIYAPHWDEWQRQWETFAAAEHPVGHADILLDGS
jgi:uridine kinase